MPSKSHWTKVWLLGLPASTVLVLLTFFVENRALVLIPTHEYGNGDFTRCIGYGLPFAFRDVLFAIDTSSASYHWGIFALDICLVGAVIVFLLHLMARANILEME